MTKPPNLARQIVKLTVDSAQYRRLEIESARRRRRAKRVELVFNLVALAVLIFAAATLCLLVSHLSGPG